MLLALVSTASNAQESRFYLGAGLGSSSIRFNSDDFDVQGTVPSVSTDAAKTGFKVLAGYRISEQMALELAHTDFGQFRYRTLATTGASYKDNFHRFDYAGSARSDRQYAAH